MTTPVALRVIVCGPAAESSVIVICPATLPTAPGVTCTENVQFAPAASVAGHVLVVRIQSALTDTLILDEDGVYDPAHFNDRLLLGLKGTMSEAELHVLRARLQGGIRNKARRGELEVLLRDNFPL